MDRRAAERLENLAPRLARDGAHGDGVKGGRKVVVPTCGIGAFSASASTARPLILLSFP
jgi:hypothetical protein